MQMEIEKAFSSMYERLVSLLIENLDLHFQSRVSIPRIRAGEHQEIDTLINEEAMLFAKYLRDERKEWNPRIVNL
jgi:hypothetical protein